jgi:hypothetical protein
MKNAILAISLITSSVSAAVQVAHAEEAGKFSLETGMDYNTGKYGGSQSTDIFYVPLTGKYQGKEWTLRLTVPYIQITGPASVISVMNGITLTGAATSNTPLTRSGLGDVVGAATHNVYNGGSGGLIVNLTGKVKLGTASSSQGLGTGQNDYALQSDLYQISGSYTTFGTLGYKIYGSPPGYTLNNIFYGSAGESYKFTQETSSGAMVSLGQKVISTGSPLVEAIFFVNHKLDKTWKAQGYFLKGFTNGVPDFGLGATVAHSL